MHSCNNKARKGNVRIDQVQQGPSTGGCIVMKKGALDQTTSDMKLEELTVIARLKDCEQYKFLGVH